MNGTNQSGQGTRQSKADNITVDEVRRMREGVFEVDFTNEDGNSRTHTLVPSEIWSSSPDMKFRGSDGHVGKYLRALAMHDDDARQQLSDGIESRESKVNEELRSIRERRNELSERRLNLRSSVQEIF